jgi:hypothetical protein
MTRKEQDIHDALVLRLEQRLKGRYSVLQREVEITDCNGTVKGKIDLVGIVDGEINLYEVKVSSSKKRQAAKQLRGYRRDLRMYAGVRCPINLRFYSGDEKGPVNIE